MHEGRIGAVGRWADLRRDWSGPVEDLGEQTLLPGLINAHCHLDYTGMRGAIMPPESFSAWIQRINALKRDFTDDDYLRGICAGLRESARFGATSVLNIEAFPELLPRVPRPPLRTWWCYELIDIRQRIATEEVVAGALSFFEERPDWLGGFGLSPHAPYTASAELYRLARAAAAATHMPVTTHLGESAEEHEMFTEARGPLYEFLARIGRPMGDCGSGRSALEILAAVDAIGPECLVAHLNETTAGDLALLAPGGQLHGLSVVHCPMSHRYFRHRVFPLAALRERGVNLCLGTDSLASNFALTLFGEMQAFSAAHAGVPPEEILRLVTLNPARALGAAGRLGELVAGAAADLIALPLAGDVDVFEQITNFDQPVTWMRVNGQIPDFTAIDKAANKTQA